MNKEAVIRRVNPVTKWHASRLEPSESNVQSRKKNKPAQQLTMLGVANDIGENVGILPGIACNKFPPWAVLMVGVFTSFLGYGVLWLAVSETRVKLKANIAPLWMLI
ncbi:hypothetical protein RJ640_006319 [Escallonia rubra]|uniref:Nodulin-like domain-containing protein n=1 Tax=Escallonia rubra TaxID=112253 RepID=A0AA88UFR3_9ASTE|nr:hypothetical protein RJ640_006319 [Escallonia rubra]